MNLTSTMKIVTDLKMHLVKTIVEIVLNTLQGNHKDTKSHLYALKKYKNALLYLSLFKKRDIYRV